MIGAAKRLRTGVFVDVGQSVLVSLFLLANLVFLSEGGPNVMARLATLAAMKEDQSFRIDSYVKRQTSWTMDWSRPPAGGYYSNKAPGPMLFAYPVFWVLDTLAVGNGESREYRDNRRFELRNFYSLLLSWVFQVLPFLLLCIAWKRELEFDGVSAEGCLLFLALAFFGSTLCVYLNCYFGHGFATVGIMGALLAFKKRRFGWMGLAFGIAVLAEYSTALLLPVFLWLGVQQKNWSRKSLKALAWGGAIPFALWIWYHTVCFGSPLAIGHTYINPALRDAGGVNLWGVLTPPKGWVLTQLLVGPTRGILFTQPWVLLVLLFFPPSLFSKKELPEGPRLVSLFSLWGFLFYLLLNASFGGWHGGYTPGPRYLSPMLPPMALVATYLYDTLPRGSRWAMGAAAAVSIAFHFSVMGTGHLIPFEKLWPYLWSQHF